jgi:hypothetical protein
MIASFGLEVAELGAAFVCTEFGLTVALATRATSLVMERPRELLQRFNSELRAGLADLLLVPAACSDRTFHLIFLRYSRRHALALMREAHHAIIIVVARASDVPTGSGTMDEVGGNRRIAGDFDKFRLRRFVERLIDMDDVEIHDEHVSLTEMSGFIEATSKALLFGKIGAEWHEVAAAVSGTPRRLAAAFGVGEAKMRGEYLRRRANPQNTFLIPSNEARRARVVLSGGDVDLTKLPFHVQHEYDARPISRPA